MNNSIYSNDISTVKDSGSQAHAGVGAVNDLIPIKTMKRQHFIDLDSLKCLIDICGYNFEDITACKKKEFSELILNSTGLAIKHCDQDILTNIIKHDVDSYLASIVKSNVGEEKCNALGLNPNEYAALEKAEFLELLAINEKYTNAFDYLGKKHDFNELRSIFIEDEPTELIAQLKGLSPNDFARFIQEMYIAGSTTECTPSEMKRVLELYLDNVPSASIIGKALRGDIPTNRRCPRKIVSQEQSQ